MAQRSGAADGIDLNRADEQPNYGWLPGKENYRLLKWMFDCALYKINFRVTCHHCRKSVVIDAPGHWYAGHRKGKEGESVRDFIRRLYCRHCKDVFGEKRRNPNVEQTYDPPDGRLLPSPGEYEWKRIVNRQRS